MIQDFPFLLFNICLPSKLAKQSDFSKTISEELKGLFTLSEILLWFAGGDFNVICDQDLDGSDGLKKTKDYLKVLGDICLE